MSYTIMADIRGYKMLYGLLSGSLQAMTQEGRSGLALEHTVDSTLILKQTHGISRQQNEMTVTILRYNINS